MFTQVAQSSSQRLSIMLCDIQLTTLAFKKNVTLKDDMV